MKELPSDFLLNHALGRLTVEQSGTEVACKICGNATELFDVLDFKRSCRPDRYEDGLAAIPVFYRSCRSCGFVFTTFFDGFTPEQWRAHVYNEYYAVVDPDYREERPRRNVIEIEPFLTGLKGPVSGLDYGGGNGMTAKLLRERGWCYDTYDPYGFSDVTPERKGSYNFCSAYEVFEHTPDPAGTLSDILTLTAQGQLLLLISTAVNDKALQPDSRLGSWWYAAPRNGHISLYSRRALTLLGERFGLGYRSISHRVHLLYRGISGDQALRILVRSKALHRIKKAMGKLGLFS